MNFLREERAVLSAVLNTLKLGFKMAMGKKVKVASLSRQPREIIAAADEQHNKADGTTPSPETSIQWSAQAFILSSLNACLYKDGAMAPFRSMFDAALLSTCGEDLNSPFTISIFSGPPKASFEKFGLSLHNDGMVTPFHTMFDPELLHDEPHGSESLTTYGNPATDSEGRTSPTSSFYGGHLSSAMSDSLPNSRRSSWATTIDSSRAEDEATKVPAEHVDVNAEPSNITEEPGVLLGYEHYQHLITVESPDYYSTASDDSGSVADIAQTTCHTADDSEEEAEEEAHVAKIASENPDLEYLEQDEITTTIEHNTAACDAEEQACLADESFIGDESSMYEDGCDASPPASPEEAAAWAHSLCPTNPEGTKVKVLEDRHGQEYVLYHDCFHCLPRRLAPEFADEFDVGDVEGCSDDDENFGEPGGDGEQERDRDAGMYEDGGVFSGEEDGEG